VRLRAELLELFRELRWFDQVPLLVADRIEGNGSVGGNDEQSGLLTERDQAARHVVRVERRTVGIGEERVRVGVGFEVSLESLDRVGGDGHDLCATGGELGMSLTQLREMFAAEGSKEPSEEHEHDRAVLECGR
jgi:hypothetical protein